MKPSALLAFAAIAGSCLAADSAPLFSWSFNEGSGDRAANQGSAGDASLNLTGPDGNRINGFTVDAKGVSGTPGDYAFNLTGATGMGATPPDSTGPAGVVGNTFACHKALSRLSSFTITGWIKPDVSLASAARIVASSQLTLMAGGEDCLMLKVNGATASAPSDPAYGDVGSWIFFAVTYDGTRETGNVVYYVGSRAADSLVVAGTSSLAAGALNSFKGTVMIGNNVANGPGARPFKGLMDNIAIYGSRDTAGGVLTKEKIEAIRAAAR